MHASTSFCLMYVIWADFTLDIQSTTLPMQILQIRLLQHSLSIKATSLQ